MTCEQLSKWIILFPQHQEDSQSDTVWLASAFLVMRNQAGRYLLISGSGERRAQSCLLAAQHAMATYTGESSSTQVLEQTLGQPFLIAILGRATSLTSKANKNREFHFFLYYLRNSSHLPEMVSALIIDLVLPIQRYLQRVKDDHLLMFIHSPPSGDAPRTEQWTPLSIYLTKGICTWSCPANPGLPNQGEGGLLSHPCWWQLHSPWRLKLHWKHRKQQQC